ncbi:MAG: hypothetical protein J6125_04200, partial [Clostridia bacterium]|nr:hypothetical protein [Clostridia bacterium]
MKKLKAMVFCFLLLGVLFFSSCLNTRVHHHTQHHGIDQFDIYDSQFCLCVHLMPEDFEKLFPYTEAGYEHHDFGDNDISNDVAVVYFRYSDDVYEEAKQFFIDNMTLSEEEYPDYASFTFHRIIGLFKEYEDPNIDEKQEEIVRWTFPRTFTMVAFSDEEKVIVAFGQVREPLSADVDVWPVFLAGNFPYFDWEAARMMDGGAS